MAQDPPSIINDGIEVRSSRIHGRGLFAIRKFRANETVVTWDMSHVLSPAEFDALKTEDKAYVCNVGDTLVLMQPPARFVNHSCDPNTETSGDGRDVARRDIEPGDEITANYANQSHSGIEVACFCGSSKCAGAFSS